MALPLGVLRKVRFRAAKGQKKGHNPISPQNFDKDGNLGRRLWHGGGGQVVCRIAHQTRPGKK
jgi:hypothetical protein